MEVADPGSSVSKRDVPFWLQGGFSLPRRNTDDVLRHVLKTLEDETVSNDEPEQPDASTPRPPQLPGQAVEASAGVLTPRRLPALRALTEPASHEWPRQQPKRRVVFEQRVQQVDFARPPPFLAASSSSSSSAASSPAASPASAQAASPATPGSSPRTVDVRPFFDSDSDSDAGSDGVESWPMDLDEVVRLHPPTPDAPRPRSSLASPSPAADADEWPDEWFPKWSPRSKDEGADAGDKRARVVPHEEPTADLPTQLQELRMVVEQSQDAQEAIERDLAATKKRMAVLQRANDMLEIRAMESEKRAAELRRQVELERSNNFGFARRAEIAEQHAADLQRSLGAERARNTELSRKLAVAEAAQNRDHIECMVCLHEPRDSVIFPCLHLACCRRCLREIVDREQPCPICKSAIRGHSLVYFTT